MKIMPMKKLFTPEDHLLRKIARSTGGLALVLTGIKILGFFEKLVLANYFGTGYEVDAYFAGFTLMVVFWDILRGLLVPSYLPTLIAYRAHVGEAKSWEFTSTVLNMMTIVFVVMIGTALLFTAPLVRLVAPGFEGERLTMAIGLTRLMLTGAGFFAVALVTGFTLNSYKRFLLAITDDVVFKVAGFLGLIALARYVGIYGLAWGIALGSWIAPVIHLIGLRKYLKFYTLTIDFRLNPLRNMFRLMLPLLAGTACIEGRRLIDNWFASSLKIGSVSALAFGYKLIEFAYKAAALPLATVVLPYFSDLALQHDHRRLNETLMTTLRTVVLLFTPLAVCLLALRYSIVRFLFERGEFDAASTQLTVTALTFYALGLVSFGVDVILLRAYFSLSDTKTPALMEVVTLAIHVGIILLFRGSLAHGSIALAFTLSKTIKVLLLFWLLQYKDINIQLVENFRFFAKTGIATLVIYLIMSGYIGVFATLFPSDAFIAQALLIGSSGCLGIGLFFVAVFFLKIQEVRDVFRAGTACIHQYIQRKGVSQ